MSAAVYYSTALTANGGVTGAIQVASTASFAVGAKIVLNARRVEPLEVKIYSIDSPTQITAKTLADAIVDLSAFTVALNARVTQPAQRDIGAFIPGTYVQRSGDTMTGPLNVGGIIHATSGGIKFPDNTIQTTAGGGGGGSLTVDQYTSISNGQTAFALSTPPIDPSAVLFLVNGASALVGIDYSVSGSSLTWNAVEFAMATGDKAQAIYQG